MKPLTGLRHLRGAWRLIFLECRGFGFDCSFHFVLKQITPGMLREVPVFLYRGVFPGVSSHFSHLTETPFKQVLCQLTAQEGVRQSTPP